VPLRMSMMRDSRRENKSRVPNDEVRCRTIIGQTTRDGRALDGVAEPVNGYCYYEHVTLRNRPDQTVALRLAGRRLKTRCQPRSSRLRDPQPPEPPIPLIGMSKAVQVMRSRPVLA
jgi:hypothetical protein